MTTRLALLTCSLCLVGCTASTGVFSPSTVTLNAAATTYSAEDAAGFVERVREFESGGSISRVRWSDAGLAYEHLGRLAPAPNEGRERGDAGFFEQRVEVVGEGFAVTVATLVDVGGIEGLPPAQAQRDVDVARALLQVFVEATYLLAGVGCALLSLK